MVMAIACVSGDLCEWVDFTNFMSAVINKASFDRIKQALDQVKESSSDAEIILGGICKNLLLLLICHGGGRGKVMIVRAITFTLRLFLPRIPDPTL